MPYLTAGLCFAAAAASVHHPVPRPGFRLEYVPRSAAPDSHTLLSTSTNGAGKLFELQLPAADQYTTNPVRLIQLEGDAAAAGEAYGELLAADIEPMYEVFVASRAQGDPDLLKTLDWLWECTLEPQTPAPFLAEIAGIARGAALATDVNITDVALKIQRSVTIATLPADAWNVEALIETEAKRHAAGKCAMPGVQALQATKRRRAGVFGGRGWGGAGSDGDDHAPGHCDFFAAWGPLTEDGRLLSSRNLDIEHDTGLQSQKLVAVYSLEGQTPYATFGYAGFAGALAGMSKAGLSVSEANLDNGKVAFDGLAWPLRLRQVLGAATTLAEARAVWAEGGPNTAAFNFLLASASGAAEGGPGAVALETTSDYTAEFDAGKESAAVEGAASFTCTAAGRSHPADGRNCSWPGDAQPFPLGAPLATAVWRSNHALHPAVMGSQEPLWNDTVARYFLIHDAILEAAAAASASGTGSSRGMASRGGAGGGMAVQGAINVTSLLGIKGVDYGSCSRANFATLKGPHESAIVLSVVYDPSRGDAYVAWEDGTGTSKEDSKDPTWRPASCTTYVKLALSGWW
jgi:hypothetical protein